MADAPAPPKKGSKLKKVLIGFVVVIGVFAVVVALQPDEFKVSRALVISAPPAAVFAQVNDLRKWEGWSPWTKLDPAMKQTYEGPPSGTGAVTTWAGNDKVGEGRMTVTESRPSELIRIKLEFLKPFEGTSTTEFAFKADGDKTSVTWTMQGRNNFVAKAICLFMDMDKTAGGDFEKGLAQLKAVSESAATK